MNYLFYLFFSIYLVVEKRDQGSKNVKSNLRLSQYKNFNFFANIGEKMVVVVVGAFAIHENPQTK